jgi:sodium/pantothenate symporter
MMSSASLMVMAAFAAYLVGVLLLGVWSHRLVARGDFVKNYFVGGRQLGPWVLAFSVATTAISGGTFAGFPSLIYSKGWVLALWIAGYMVVPLTAMILLGKRLNQVARVSGAVTVPDVFRDRYQSPTLGLVCTGVIFVFILANMVAQFKAGGTVLKVAMGLPSDWLVTLPLLGWRVEAGYLIGLVIFSLTVIAYTTYGGFWAVTWTDVLEGTVKIIGVILLAVLAVASVPAVSTPDGQTLTGLGAATERLRQQDPALITGPGPGQFLPLGLAFSFFLMWTLSSAGQPSGMVRLMSFRDTPSLKRALIVVCAYYAITYSCLVIIFVCARAIFPTEYLPGERPEKLGNPDDIMPAMARYLAPHPLIAGLLLAAPYAAVMSTVAAFLLMISSGLVRDVYQRTINPNVTARTIKIISYTATATVGLAVMIAALNPPQYLQYLIVFTGTGQSCAFLMPMLLMLYWRRATRQGVLAGIVGGAATVLVLYLLGWLDAWTRPGSSLVGPATAARVQANFAWVPGWGADRLERIAPIYVGDCDPLVWGMLVSLLCVIGVSLCTRPDPEQTRRYFPD